MLLKPVTALCQAVLRMRAQQAQHQTKRFGLLLQTLAHHLVRKTQILSPKLVLMKRSTNPAVPR